MSFRVMGYALYTKIKPIYEPMDRKMQMRSWADITGCCRWEMVIWNSALFCLGSQVTSGVTRHPEAA